MISEDGDFVLCDEEGCEVKRKNHMWGAIKSEGWFDKKDGTHWCPAHIPTWVAKWRETTERKKAERNE